MTLDPRHLDAAVDELRPQLEDLSRRIHSNPELRFEEHRAAAWIAEDVERISGLPVERGVGGLPTALRARAGRSGGPKVVACAEYDALPEIGHACGHNLIAAGAVGAFLALARHAAELPGTIELLGTPAEEGGGGKIRLIEAGAFQGADAAMMFHPFDRDLLAHPALASSWITMTYRGKPSHASAAPHEGRSALTACLETFRLIDSQRVHFRDGVRVHGYVTNGGQAVNIIPEHAASEFSVRARDLPELRRVTEIVRRCAEGAALACGVEVELARREGYRDMRNNMTLARAFGEHLRELGRPAAEGDASVGAGSTDMGDVSHVVPSIHPYMAICGAGETLCHEHPFAAAAAAPRGHDAMIVAAKAMARTALSFLRDGDLRDRVRADFIAENRATLSPAT